LYTTPSAKSIDRPLCRVLFASQCETRRVAIRYLCLHTSSSLHTALYKYKSMYKIMYILKIKYDSTSLYPCSIYMHTTPRGILRIGIRLHIIRYCNKQRTSYMFLLYGIHYIRTHCHGLLRGLLWRHRGYANIYCHATTIRVESGESVIPLFPISVYSRTAAIGKYLKPERTRKRK
jgi:hypothetical protein